jgi:hypothetical protein
MCHAQAVKVRHRTEGKWRVCDAGRMTALLRNDFDAFLYGPIGEDANGMPVSLLTAMARRDIDAWNEAAELAELPIESANARLASLLETIPNGPPPGECVRVATRLVALLHQAHAPRVHSAAAPAESATAGRFRTVNPAIYYVIALIVMLLWLWARG